MGLKYIFILTVCVLHTNAWSDNRLRSFNKDFMFGVASSAYQVEGAWNVDGKGESMWDRYLHTRPDVIADGRNGDVASDSYHQYKRDVEMLRELGVDHYRFSISWPRVLPTGFTNVKNEKGLEYYDNLINELLKYNIEPMVTLYHFDLPQTLQELGGWASPLVVQWFEDYAKVLFERYGDRVKYWITINQPSFCFEGYGGIMAPALDSKGIGDYMCLKHVLLAHATAYRLYEREYKKKYKGSVGISLSLNYGFGFDNKTENEEAAEIYRDFTIGMYMNPIWSKYGDFPKTVKSRVLKKSKEQGYEMSRLPTLSPEEIKLLKGSADFLGVNHYTSVLVKPQKTEKFEVPSFEDDIGVEISQSVHWPQSKSSWLKSSPFGIYRLYMYINQKYDYPQTFITEQGWSSEPGLNDRTRVDYLREYLVAVLFAIEDGAQIMGYTVWSLMDNVEWVAGTSERFGLYEVDFESEEKTRTARLSALVYKRIIQKRIVEKDWEPDNWKISITQKKKKDEL
ncbi:myrosinase 1-like [Pieris napi]|uniref:myrosinase 1-like n=1 Tax=Pieris napi TaxID=78633 RepID=UPI001FB92D0F|nr:myrosinase 1-like [Pieris napi]